MRLKITSVKNTRCRRYQKIITFGLKFPKGIQRKEKGGINWGSDAYVFAKIELTKGQVLMSIKKRSQKVKTNSRPRAIIF